MSVKDNFPTTRPSLLLDFANTKVLDPRITYSRASTATFYDGKTVAKAEENLLTYSQEFDNAAWTVGATIVTANTAVAPDGTSTADTVTETTAASTNHVVQSSIATAANTVYCLSVFAKPASGTRFLTISIDGSSSAYASATFDLSTGVVTQTLQVGYTSTAGTITASSNGYYRCSFVTTTNSTAATLFRISLSETGTFVSFTRGMTGYTGNGTSGVYLWGAQLEQRSSVTAYTPTTTQPITNYIPVLQTAAANVARFDHNPVTGESLGLRIEEQRTNLLIRSEEFSNAAWSKDGSSITANVAVAPDGTLTGDLMIATTPVNSHQIYRGAISITPGTTYTYSVYAKYAGYQWISISAYDGNERHSLFDLVNGVTGSNAAGNTPSITPIGNGWYRCSVTRTVAASVTYGQFFVSNANNTAAFAGDGYSGIYIWGAQLEAGSFATSYIPTVASQVTRSADSASMTGTNFSSWYRADEGTLYAETVPATSGYSPVFQADNGTADNRILVEGGVDAHGFVRTNAATACSIDMGATSANTNAKFAFAYKVNDFAGSLNAGAVGTDTEGTLPVVTTARIGANTSISYTQTIKKLAYYPARLTNTQLQALTQQG